METAATGEILQRVRHPDCTLIGSNISGLVQAHRKLAQAMRRASQQLAVFDASTDRQRQRRERWNKLFGRYKWLEK